MKVSRLLFVAGLVAAGLLATPTVAQEPKKDDIEKAAARAEAVNDIASAAHLAAYGRGELFVTGGLKGVKSPEALVAAGGLLLRANKATEGKMGKLDAPTGADGKTLKPEADTGTLEKDAEALFDEARVMAGKDKAKAAAIEALIKKAKDIEVRDAVGGPRRIVMAIKPGETQTHKVPYVGGLPAAVSLTSPGPMKLDFEITNNAGESLFNIRCTYANYSWNPKGGPNRVVTFSVTNISQRPTTYTIVTN